MSKRKGPSQTLPLAVRMQMQKAARDDAIREENTALCMALYYRAGGIALNRLFGFGEKKILDFQHELERIMAEVRDEKVGVDLEYAFTALDRGYRQIVKSIGEEKEAVNS